MKRLFSLVTAILAVLTFFSPVVVQAAASETKTVDSATQVLKEIMKIPEKGIPPELLKDAHGVAVFPGLLKAGFVVGGRYGKGILVVRNADGSWSNPSFVSLAGGSVGWQIGAQSTDVILVFKTAKSVDAISRGKFTLGAEASIAAGPVGRRAEASTDVQLKAEIYSYSRSRGLFAGVALDGALMEIDDASNAKFYSKRGITAEQIFTSSKGYKVPYAAKNFKRTLAKYTSGPRRL